MRTRIRGVRAGAATLLAVAALATAAVTPALAIRHGSLDGTDHPYVGLMTAHSSNGNYLWRCSGTLISPWVFVTAGHCVDTPSVTAEIYFDAGPIIPDAAFDLSTRSCSGIAGYPCGGGWSGTNYENPLFDSAQFFLHDIGVVVLDSPVYLSEYGLLPSVGQLDSLAPSASTTFLDVGYGLQAAFPDATAWKDQSSRTRMDATVHLVQINTPFTGTADVLVSDNAAGGGTCFGDSGGPNFIGSTRVIGGVNSFVLNSTCGGVAGFYRIDHQTDLDWVNTFLN